MVINKRSNNIVLSLITVILLAGCPISDPPTPPSPTPSPIISPTPIETLPPVTTSDTEFLPIISDNFEIKFGPGSKGISYFGPGSKGVSNFGPGSKGVSGFGPGSKGVSTFGPGSKGVSNLRFNINFAQSLVRSDLAYFATQAVETDLFVRNLKFTIKKGNDIIATTNVLPRDNKVEFKLDLETKINAENYTFLVEAENNIRNINYNTLIKLESNTEVKIVLYAKEIAKIEDLDIAVRTKPIKPE